MIRSVVCVLVVLFVGAPTMAADDRYTVTGLVMDVRPETRTFVASIDPIPGFMAAMVMPFNVRDAAELRGIVRGAQVQFTLVVSDSASWAERITVRRVENLEQDPLAARRLALIQEFTDGRAAAVITAGGLVPDFQLIDHKERSVALSDFRGKVVAVNFMYTTCQLPDFCLRIVNHFGALQRRFSDELGRDLIFLTITFDPARDQPDVLDRYAAQWKPNHDTWRFLTGPVADVRRVLGFFGMAAFMNEGLMDHGLRTAIIGRDGRLVTNLEGNHYSSDQLGDLIASVLRQRSGPLTPG
jgi:protein SCO1/2